ncbi:MAG: hypothetical protein HY855_23330 [Burkholderiales bacterium]|nr:hypothetical protein [Burkholderiales bacterium]
MRRLVPAGACLVAGALLQGCIATYVPAPDERMTTVRSVGFGRPQLCKDGQFYWAPEAPGVPDAVSVPAGRRVTLGAHMVSAGYQVTHFCRPFLSFVPEVGRSYVMNSALSGNGQCVVELVRAEPSSDTGLAVEPSVGRAECLKGK